MHVQTRLLTGFKKTLTYEVPEHLRNNIFPGNFILVPLRNTQTLAYVIKVIHSPIETSSYQIKQIIDIAPFPRDTSYQIYLQKLGQYYAIDPFFFIKRLRNFINQDEIDEKPSLSLAINKHQNNKLTDEQQTVYDFIAPAVESGKYQPTLLHGVTGSGKTEVYKKLILKTYEEKKSVLLLVPEVTLAVQFFSLLKNQLPEHIMLHQFHSASTGKEKKQLWNDLLANKPLVIVGVHLTITLPIENLGLIIVDEEHEIGYQEKKHPKINSKEAAVLRAHTYQIPILLGSATPSVTSLYYAQTNKWHYFQLTKRFAGNFPEIKTVNLLDKKKRDSFWVSTQLEKEITERLSRKEQVIIFLNRRGYSFFVMCTACSYIFTCAFCSVSLTLHEDGKLRCHYCDYKILLPHYCTSCKAPESALLKKGIGTQQLAQLLQKKFPTARIGRADLDTTKNKKKWQQILDQFERGDLDILVGTQTITKGYHFPGVTLVGIIWADANLHFPKYNATETAIQQLIQVAGRAGRQTQNSMVIVQTCMDHEIFTFLNEKKYRSFYEREIKKREIAHYPPFTRFIEIELRNTHENILIKEAVLFAQKLTAETAQAGLKLSILGPALLPVSKIKNVFTRVIYIKSSSITNAQFIFSHVLEKNTFKSLIFFTPNIVS